MEEHAGPSKNHTYSCHCLVTGSLYASIRVQDKQLIYLHKVLLKQDTHWTKTTLKCLRESDRGWAKQIDENLEQWGLETEWDRIKGKTRNEWKHLVNAAAEKVNRERLMKECHRKERVEEIVTRPT